MARESPQVDTGPVGGKSGWRAQKLGTEGIRQGNPSTPASTVPSTEWDNALKQANHLANT